MNDVAKLRIKSEKLKPLGGISLAMEQFGSQPSAPSQAVSAPFEASKRIVCGLQATRLEAPSPSETDINTQPLPFNKIRSCIMLHLIILLNKSSLHPVHPDPSLLATRIPVHHRHFRWGSRTPHKGRGTQKTSPRIIVMTQGPVTRKEGGLLLSRIALQYHRRRRA